MARTTVQLNCAVCGVLSYRLFKPGVAKVAGENYRCASCAAKGNKNSAGRKLSAVHKLRIREGMKGKRNGLGHVLSEERRNALRYKRSYETRMKMRESTLRQLQNAPLNGLEKIVALKLEDAGIKYVAHFLFEGMFVVDFFIPEKNTVIECDGDYWHSLPKARKADMRKNKIMREKGVPFVRIREIDARKWDFSIVERLEAVW